MAPPTNPSAGGSDPSPPPRLVDRADQLATVVEQCRQAGRIALDIEGNGLHAYEPRLCVLQLAWRAGDQVAAAVVDPLVLPVAPLAVLIGSAGPVKVLHDLTFDARMLSAAGIELGNVRDTSVAARFLGAPATGLAALVSARLGIALDKQLQDHDWAQRPFTAGQLAYLAGDVRHLLDLDDALSRAAEERGIAPEIAVECGYKLAGALAPPQDQRPSYVRVKGYGELARAEQAVLRRLVQHRDTLARAADVPPFRIAPNAVLLALARRKPRDVAQLTACCGRRRRLTGEPERWLGAVRRGLDDGAPPADEQPRATASGLSRREIALRKRLSSALSSWRRQEARRRGVDAQVVLPGHRLGPLVAALAAATLEAPGDLRDRLAALSGLGACRLERYAQPWHRLAERAWAALERSAEGQGG